MYRVHQILDKYTGIYRCADDINNFKIRIKIKEIPDISLATELELQDDWEIHEFKWQEKIFNNFEKQYYLNEKNCVTDAEKQYNSILANSVASPDNKILFSYVDCDNFNVEEEGVMRNEANVGEIDNSLDEVLEDESEFDFRSFLQQAIENVVISDDYCSMYIMADFGEYVQENWVKFEHVLCTMKYNKEKNILKVHPDFSNNIPYLLEVNVETLKNYYYFIENVQEDIPEQLNQKENEIFKKISHYRRSHKNLGLNQDFDLPAKNKLEVHIFFEIVSGSHFEYDDIYVRYFIDLPDKWTCKTPFLLNGMTQTCHGKNEDNVVYFGHIFDLILEYDIQDFFQEGLPKLPYIYFEIASRGSWDRHRCEGLTYHSLPVGKPGVYEFVLPSYRLTTGTTGELRRFFIGDCSNYNDITWVGIPKAAEGPILNKYGVQTIGSGMLNIRMNVMHQSQAFLEKYNETDVIKNKEKFIFEKLNSSTLVKSVEQVLEAFKRARKNMIQARNM
ncbi:hypothetical protein HHI36_021548 [Cryptolaemus montrouzieri]|uniref:Meckel syndrome type 1 protein n=1 Tax=Cryptolaemus montrouzieri TaxID=559131 RepID=A0ABD2MX53_9CUCU